MQYTSLVNYSLTVISSQALVLNPRDRFDVEAIRWRADVYRFAYAMTRDEAEAEDVVQDTYLRAFKSWQTFAAGTDCRRWLFTICRNVFLRTREKNVQLVSLDALDVAPVIGDVLRDDIADPRFELPERELELGTAIYRALARVPEPYRSTLLVVDLYDQPYDVAATRLGVPIGTIRSRLSRGRRMMQQQLWAYAADAGLREPERRLAG
jgi:RNA polymerase sigma-70 factor (ECF subfamily)